MYDDLYEDADKTYEYQNITDMNEIKKILNLYMDKYFNIDDKDTWFNKIS